MFANTGIQGLDKYLGGGVPVGVTLIIGPPGSGKTTFARQFVRAGLEKDESCIYLITNESPHRLRESLKVTQLGSLKIIDCYSWRLTKDTSYTEEASYKINNPMDFNEILTVISKCENELKEHGSRMRLIIDSFSTFILNDLEIDPIRGASSAFNMLATICAKVKKSGMISLISLVEGVHNDAIINRAKFICDAVIELKLVSKVDGGFERFIRIPMMKCCAHYLSKIPIKITEYGIEIVEKKVALWQV
jgi:KaiC/GvpD/RAD55 family RecA-like ATPase